ncbi:MAG: NERD domain-containing protein [Euryarchaeota archaeon]|nr:NERD domain-containing protein [Euryarchaeota archaeon]
MTRTYPERKYRELRGKRRVRALSFFILSFVLFLTAIYISFRAGSQQHGIIISLATLLSGLIFALLGKRALKISAEERIYRAGAMGEKQFKKILSQTDGYKFYGVPLKYGDIDALLISKRGVFAFEVKNYSGEIHCESGIWYRILRGKKEHINSPSEEALRHANALSRLLENCGIHTHVRPVVVFMNAQGRLQIHRCSVTVIHDKELLPFLSKFPPILRKNDKKSIAKCVKEQMFRNY